MKCSDARLVIGAEPQGMSAELEQHLRECAGCEKYRCEMLALDEQIKRALSIDVAALKPDASPRSNMRLVASAPAESPAPSSSSRGGFGRQWALAASVLATIGVAFVLWGGLPRHSLAADVVAHVVSEPLPATEEPVPMAALAGVLQGANVKLDPINQKVVFAQTCFLRGRLIPHFVVKSGDAVVTVLIMPDEAVKSAEHFERSGYGGVLLPVRGHGSIAVLSRKRIDSEKEAQEILNALHFETPV